MEEYLVWSRQGATRLLETQLFHEEGFLGVTGYVEVASLLPKPAPRISASFLSQARTGMAVFNARSQARKAALASQFCSLFWMWSWE